MAEDIIGKLSKLIRRSNAPLQLPANPESTDTQLTKSKPFKNLLEAKRFISQESSIANTDSLRDAFFNSASIKEIQRRFGIKSEDLNLFGRANRRKNLNAFNGFFQELTSTPKGRKIIATIASEKKYQAKVKELSKAVDKRFSNANDILYTFILEGVLKDDNLRRSWLKAVDKRVSESSEANLAAIDIAASIKGKRLIEKDIVIVGGGPLTSLITAILSPYFEITVITDKPYIGEPWRSRAFYINSSVAPPTAKDLPLPILQSTTTPISPQKFVNHVSLGNLVDKTALTVDCDETGVTKSYISGSKALGPAIATNIALDVNDFIVGQTVDPKKIIPNNDGSTTLTIEDEDGKRRRIIAKNGVINLTGPGGALSTIKDRVTNNIRRRFSDNLTKSITGAKKTLRELNERLNLYNELKKLGNNSSLVQANIKSIQAEIDKVQIDIPRYLNLTDIEAIYQFWLNDLNADPRKYPFARLFNPRVSIGVIGGGDSGNVIAELFQGEGPPEAYPGRIDDRFLPRVFLFGQPAQSLESLRGVLRRRYFEVYKRHFGKTLFTTSDKVLKVDFPRGQKDGPIRLTSARNSGTVDYVIDTTGFGKTPIQDAFSFSLDPIRDIEGEVVALGRRGLSVVGTATEFELADFPLQIQKLITGLNIRENTKSLWVFAILAERFAWSLATKLQINQQKVLDALADARQTENLRSLVVVPNFTPLTGNVNR